MSAVDVDLPTYDLFVIGAGSGGVRAARIAAGFGAKVAIAEEYRVGGTCVIRGCVPKKLLVYASRFADEFHEAAGFGWTVGPTTFDWPTLIANKDKEITRLEGLYAANIARSKVEIHKSRAVLTGPNTVRLVADNRTITAKTILIATGGAPKHEAFPGQELTITSNEAFDLPTLPKRIVVVGGGYIAVEFAGIFHGLGVDTTLVYRGAKILRGFDEDMRDGLTEALIRRGIKVITGETIAAVVADGVDHQVTLSGGSRLVADHVMMAIGRAPNVAGLGLETAGVKRGARGEIPVDAFSQTNVPGIYAVGDVTDRANLTPIAIREGHAFADTVFGGKPTKVDHARIPTAVFSTPEIGTVGLSEADARTAGHDLDIYKANFRPMKATLSGATDRMIMKLVVDAKTQLVLGCHVLGPDAGEIIQMAAIALELRATKADFDRTVALHPSAAEELVTMREKWTPPKA
jgi:glutathione reductase (NADPH)